MSFFVPLYLFSLEIGHAHTEKNELLLFHLVCQRILEIMIFFNHSRSRESRTVLTYTLFTLLATANTMLHDISRFLCLLQNNMEPFRVRTASSSVKSMAKTAPLLFMKSWKRVTVHRPFLKLQHCWCDTLWGTSFNFFLRSSAKNWIALTSTAVSIGFQPCPHGPFPLFKKSSRRKPWFWFWKKDFVSILHQEYLPRMPIATVEKNAVAALSWTNTGVIVKGGFFLSLQTSAVVNVLPP